VRQWSDYAMIWLMDRAESTIRTSQQDLAMRKAIITPTPRGNPKVIKAFADAIDRGVQVYVILSNTGDWDYSSDVPYYNIARRIRNDMTGSIPDWRGRAD
jgi:accessory colonization factor AcfC